jgi:regulator of cell morphogenesis and NO signaling
METIEQQTLSGIALRHHEAIPVLEKYGLDFCCRGKKTLQEACSEKNIDMGKVIGDMKQAERPAKSMMPFTEMNAEQLISYILVHHHFYVRNSIPVIMNHLEKLLTKHGGRYPYIKEVFQIFTEVKDELLPHMEKEERILFPRIREIATMTAQQILGKYPSAYINAPVLHMESEHDHAGQLLYKIRSVTGDYTAPEDACTTHRVCLEELKAFEADLHNHVHLENNILFPMASAFFRMN